MVVTPDWITQCILEKSLVNAEGYHPSLLIDPSKEKSPVQPPIEPLKNVKLSEKKEEVKPRIVEETKPIEVKAAEIKTVPETPAVVQQPAPQEVVNHAPTTITAPPSTKNMRIASNLPPHLEQQLQQHSMMRNTAPRQQHQGVGAHSGIRMVRSGSGTTWRGANQQQQATLQRSVSHPASGVDQRPQQQTIQGVRMGTPVQQIRGQTNQSAQSGANSQPVHHQQSMQQQLPGMVRQVRLVNPATQQQPGQPASEQPRLTEVASQQQRGQAINQNTFQQVQHRLPMNQSPQIVKMVVTQPQADGKPLGHSQQTPVSSPLINQQQQQMQFTNIYSQNGQQIQSAVQQPAPGQVVSQQQHHFQQVTEDNTNVAVNNANPQLRQQQQAIDGSYPSVQVQNNSFPQQHQRINVRMPMTANVQQQGAQGPQQQQVMIINIFCFLVQFLIRDFLLDNCAFADDSTTTVSARTSCSTTGRVFYANDDA